MDERRETLFTTIQQRSVFLGKDHPVISPTGHRQGWLIDLRMSLLDGEALQLVADLFWGQFADRLPFQVGGLETAAIPLVVAIIMAGRQRGTPVNGFVVRKERKPHGLSKTIEGTLTADPVVIVDDLINSGSGMEKVRTVVGEEGHPIRDLFVVIDYESGEGQRWLHNHGVRLTSLFRLSDFGLELKPVVPQVAMSEFRTVWKFRAPEPNYFHVVPKSTPALDDERIFVGSECGTFWALAQATGQVVWSAQVRDSGRKKIWSSPAVHEGRVYFGGYDGNVYCLDARSGAERWRFTGADWVGSSPALAPTLGLLFIGLEHEVPGRRGSLAALDMGTGTKVWELPAREYLHGTPLYCPSRGAVAVGTNDRDLVLADARTGRLIWRFPTKGEIKYAPALDAARNAVIFGSFDGTIYVVDLDSGRAVWSVPTGNIIYSTPLVVGDRAYVVSTDKHLYVLDLAKRAVIKRLHVGSKLYSSPRAIEGRIYFGSTGGLLLELDPERLLFTGRLQLPDRITNPVTYSERHRLYYALTYDNQLFALARTEEPQ
jgi:outer membrane protein assembly factor BamB/orotate phosphoribosyltransferase